MRHSATNWQTIWHWAAIAGLMAALPIGTTWAQDASEKMAQPKQRLAPQNEAEAPELDVAEELYTAAKTSRDGQINGQEY